MSLRFSKFLTFGFVSLYDSGLTNGILWTTGEMNFFLYLYFFKEVRECKKMVVLF